MNRLIALVLLLIASSAISQPFTFAWDKNAQPILDSDISYDLMVNGVSASGITGKSATVDVPISPGGFLDAKVRAIYSGPNQCQTNPTQDQTLCTQPAQFLSTAECPTSTCAPSTYTTLAATLPQPPGNFTGSLNAVATMPLSIENTSSVLGTLNDTSLTFAHTITSANLLIVGVAAGDNVRFANGSVSGITYGGVALTKVVHQDEAQFEFVEIWKLANPTPGTANVVVSFTGTMHELSAGSTGFIGADTTLGTPSSAFGTTANPSVNVASATGSIVYGVYASDLGPVGTTTPVGTQLWEFENVNSDSDFSAQQLAGSATVACGWTAAASSPDKWAIAGVSINAGGGGGTQALTLSIYNNTNTFYAATVGRGAVGLTSSLFTDADIFPAPTVLSSTNLTPSLYSDPDTFPAPTVGRGTVNVTPALFADADTFPSATVGRGAVGLLPSIFTDTDIFYTPTVSLAGAPQTLTPSLYANVNNFYVPTVGRGAVGLTPALFADADSFYSPVVSLAGSPQTLTASLFVDPDIFYAATVGRGPVGLSPSLFADSDTFPSPLVASSKALTPSLFTDTDTFFTPTVGRGAVGLSPVIYTDADTFYQDTVSLAGAPQTLTAAKFTNVNTFYSPVIASSNALLAALFADVDTFYTPTIGRGPVSIAPSLFNSINIFYNAIVTQGQIIGYVINPSAKISQPDLKVTLSGFNLTAKII